MRIPEPALGGPWYETGVGELLTRDWQGRGISMGWAGLRLELLAAFCFPALLFFLQLNIFPLAIFSETGTDLGLTPIQV